MIRTIGIDQPCGLMYESNCWALKKRGNVLTRNPIFDHFVEQIGGIDQKRVLAHALAYSYPSKVLAPVLGANAPVEVGFWNAVDYPTAKWVTKAGKENHQLFWEQTYHYTRTSTEQTWYNTTTGSSLSTAHKEVPQYQRNEHRLDPGVVPESVGASTYVWPKIRGKWQTRTCPCPPGIPICNSGKAKKNLRMTKLKQGSSSYKNPSVSTNVNSSQRKNFWAKTEKLDKLNNELESGPNCGRKFIQSFDGFFCCKCGDIEKANGELRKQDYCFHQNCSRPKEFDKAQPTSEGAIMTLPSFYSKRKWRYNTERWTIVSAFCHSIEQICRANNQKITTKIAQPKTGFHSAVTPDISVSDFLKRIGWFCDCPKECFVIALEYIHRTVQYKPEIQVNFNSAHHLILTCLLVSVKFYDDAVLNQKYYAQVVGLPAVDISSLEKELLFLLSFDLFVLPGRYQQILKQMLNDNKGIYKVDLRPELN